MTAEDGESYAALVEQRLGRQGLEVKLDRGFEDGVYCVYVEFVRELLEVISLSEGGGSRASEPGPSGSPTVERHGGPQHAGEAGTCDVSEARVPQGPRGKVKAKLPEVQSRSGHT